MKIMVVGNFGRSWDGSICDEKHIAIALAEAGHRVIQHPRDNPVTPSGEFDFILIAQWNGYPVDLVPFMKTVYPGVPIVYWAFDYQFDKNEPDDDCHAEDWHLRLATEADVFLSKELEHQSFYRNHGANFHWLPQDFAPNSLNTDWGNRPKKDIDVLFTGSWLPWAPERTEILRAVDKHFNLTIHSFTPSEWEREGFKDVRGPVMDEGLKDLIPRAKVNLSIDWKLSEGYWSDRVSQLLCAGGLVLNRYVPASEIVFRDNVVYFYDTVDCLDKVQYYLEHEQEALEIAKRGYEYAQGNLKVNNRVKDLLTIVGEFLCNKSL